MTRAVERNPVGVRPDTPRTLPDGTVLRPLSGARGELEECADLQRAIWGQGFSDVAAPQILRIVQSMGGVAAGAFAPDGDPKRGGRMLGFVFGITGFKDGRPMHWSHMLAVLPEARGCDLGYQLKLYQRERLLPLGIDVVRWTYDPLVSKNAYLNLVRLGARAIAYEEDYYGSGEDSTLSVGLGTDRFIVEWRLEDEPGAPPDADSTAASGVRSAPVVDGPPEAGAGDGPPVVRVEVPGDIQAVRRESAERATAWRRASRGALVGHLERGYEVTGFYRERSPDPGGGRTGESGRSFYVLRKGGS